MRPNFLNPLTLDEVANCAASVSTLLPQEPRFLFLSSDMERASVKSVSDTSTVLLAMELELLIICLVLADLPVSCERACLVLACLRLALLFAEPDSTFWLGCCFCAMFLCIGTR